MKLAWFTPRGAGAAADGFEAAALIEALRTDHTIEVFDAARAHDFVWMQARTPFDLCVYDLDDSPAHEYVWAYVCHYPGLVRLPGERLRTSRLAIRLRDARAQVTGTMPTGPALDALHAVVMHARLCVVPDAAQADLLADRYPGARFREAPIGAPPVEGPPLASPPVRVGIAPGPRATAALDAVRRARDLGAPLVASEHTSLADLAGQSHIVVALEWPPTGIPLAGTLGMAAGRAVVMLETESTSALPCLDPQTWQPRGSGVHPAAAITLDPRDESHSLVLALGRLGTDAALRGRLGTAARGWWSAHGTLASSAAIWRAAIADAAQSDPPPGVSRGIGRLADGSERARTILADIGASVDFLD